MKNKSVGVGLFVFLSNFIVPLTGAQEFSIRLQQEGMLTWSNTVCAPCTFRVDRATELMGPWATATNVVVTNRLVQTQVDVISEPVAFFRAVALSTLGDNLLAYYPLDGDGRDASGHAHHGLAEGTIPTTNRFDSTASALSFANNPAQWVPAVSRITIEDAPELRLTNSLSITAWFRTSDSNGRHIIAKELGTGMNDSFVLWYEFGQAFIFQLEDTSGTPHYVSTAIPSPGVWHHVAGVWDGAVLRLYLDGAAVDSAPFSGIVRYDSNPIYIGADDNDGDDIADEGWKGAIDEVRIYGRALSQGEVLQIYGLPW
jgi:hypothetical protein